MAKIERIPKPVTPPPENIHLTMNERELLYLYLSLRFVDDTRVTHQYASQFAKKYPFDEKEYEQLFKTFQQFLEGE